MTQSTNIVIFGNGAMAKVLYSYARSSLNIVGFTVDDQCIHDHQTEFLGLPLVPFSKVESVFRPQEHQLIIAVGFIEMNDLRGQKYFEAQQKGYSFGSYIHNSVLLHDDVSIGENSIILDMVSIHPGCQLGHSTFISSNVNIGHDCIIAPNNWINSGVAVAGGCDIGEGCFFGVNASLGHGVEIGKQNFIAANTLVTSSTQDGQVFISEPGQLFKLSSKSFLKFSNIFGS